MNISNKIEFHVDHNVKPKNIEKILLFLTDRNFIKKEDLFNKLNNYGYGIHYRHFNKNLFILGKFNILNIKNGAYILSKTGMHLQNYLNFDKKVFYDLMHFLYFTSWDYGDHKSLYFSWSYKTICEILWNNKPIIVNRKKLAADLLNAAHDNFEIKDISISHEAITGIFNWVNALMPSFINNISKNEIGEGREGCSPELFIITLGYLYKTLNLNIGTPILLDKIKKEFICKTCLLNEDSFDKMLNLTIKTFDYISKDYGEWGAFLMLKNEVKIDNLC